MRDHVPDHDTVGYTRHFFKGADVTLSYVDFGGGGQPLIALHGHMNEGLFVRRLAGALTSEYRVIALDQRGHGESERPLSYDNERYVDDALALLNHLGIDEAVLLGHSLGGVVAYRLAACVPGRVSALIIEDIGAVVNDRLDFILDWPPRMPTKDALIAALGRLGPAFAYSMREYEDGWGLPFAAEDMILSQEQLNGDHWKEWLATDCPALLLHGMRSPCLSHGHAEEMAAKRPGTKLVHLDAGHTVHVDSPDRYLKEIRRFLGSRSS